MKSTFRPTTEADGAAVGAFLTRIFSMPEDHVTARPDHLVWKYWAPHPGPWRGSRGGVLERDGAIVAHGAAWPLRILAGPESIEAIHLIDWAADPAATGAGVSILKQMTNQVDAAIAVGGTDMTVRILPSFGFKPQNIVRYYARVLRPWKQALTHQHRNWKTPVRLIRSLWWRYVPPLTVAKGWSARRIAPESLPEHLLPRPSAGIGVFARSTGLFRYLTSCPVAEFVLYLVAQDGRPRGYFGLFLVPGSARIADAWAVSDEVWRPLYALAAAEARRHGSSEIVTAAAIAPAQAGLLASGYRVRKQENLVVYDRSGKLAPGLSYHFQMVDSDIAFLHANAPDYLT